MLNFSTIKPFSNINFTANHKQVDSECSDIGIKITRPKWLKVNTYGDVFEKSVTQNLATTYKDAAEHFLNDIELVAKRIPNAIFDRKTFSQTVLKRKDRIVEKFLEKGEINDSIRTTIYMPKANENYIQVISEMKKLGYEVRMIPIDPMNLRKSRKVLDVTVRHGDNAQPSGYEDVAIKFVRSKKKDSPVYELIILPGSNYWQAKEEEHKIYEGLRKFGVLHSEDEKVKENASIIKTEFRKLSKQIYANAKRIDTYGLDKGKVVEFTTESINIISEAFDNLRVSLLEEFIENNPEISKNQNRLRSEFTSTDDYKLITEIEDILRPVIYKYRPVQDNE